MKVVGVGTRVLNFLVDTTIILILTYIINKVNTFYVSFWHFRGFAFWKIFSAVLVVYYVLGEGIFGKSLGKKMTYTIIVKKDGGAASFGQILIRSLVRLIPIDFMFIPFTDRTLHDILSNTYIIEK
ncbi:RDD family protein [Rhizosphaericola mali]|uniref:RDD family protein n=1 Tax=Rhizosphaericola mali TaxID=2545455 RepID=A0A5P2G2Y7_9BACT|nr:RDD family protein [Rhizosphaericola mali]QES90184.1 RDD family protein [Rhizosphaericola mali]